MCKYDMKGIRPKWNMQDLTIWPWHGCTSGTISIAFYFILQMQNGHFHRFVFSYQFVSFNVRALIYDGIDHKLRMHGHARLIRLCPIMKCEKWNETSLLWTINRLMHEFSDDKKAMNYVTIAGRVVVGIIQPTPWWMDPVRSAKTS